MARITVPTPDITPGVGGFDGRDLLGRAETGRRLSDLVERIEEPLVIALDGQWGSGKSFFLKCWTGAHANENGGTARVIYFDAFENDYLTDPLIALVATIDRYLEPVTLEQKSGLEQVKKAVTRLIRPATRIAIAGAAGAMTALAGAPEAAGAAAVAGAAASDAIGAAASEMSGVIDVWGEAKEQQSAMERFRAGLKSLTAPNGDEPARKLVLVIDELDRCRPDYALSLIEIAKHFFAVDNVHFILGANLAELQNSVRARYGSGIDAQRYLQKFISLNLSLQSYEQGAAKRSLALTYLEAVGRRIGLNSRVQGDLLSLLETSGLRAKVTLRDVDRMLSYCSVLPGGSDRLYGIAGGYRFVLLTLIIFRVMSPILYERARHDRLTPQAVFDELFSSGEPDRNSKRENAIRDLWNLFFYGPDQDEERNRERYFDPLHEGEHELLSELIHIHMDQVDVRR